MLGIRSFACSRFLAPRPPRRVFLLALVVMVAGCGFAKAKEDAGRAVEAHFKAIASHSSEAVLAGYDERFFEAVPREEWARRLAIVNTKLGEFKSYSVVNWNVNSKVGTDAGTHVSLNCKVIYSKHRADEAMVLFRSSDDREFKIIRHGINSDAVLSE